MEEKTVYHIDVNSAYLSWEAVYRLKFLGARTDLRRIPSAIGGDISQRHGIILAKSIPAKKYNIKTGESILEARQKCPELIIVPPNYGLYERCSNSFMDILREYTPEVEPYSIDEAFMDMTGTERLWGTPVATANQIRERIRDELGFTVNIGVSSNKLLAKMASDFKKPDRVHTLFPEEIEEKMWPLPVSELIFVGRATARKLMTLGLRTIGDLAKADPKMLRSHLKKQGEIVWGFANGIDMSQVQSQTVPNKGYGNSTTIAWDVGDAPTAKKVLLALAETVGKRLREAGVRAEVIAVGIRSADLQYAGHQMTLRHGTNVTNEIYQYACELFDQLWDGAPIRHLGIHTSRLQDGLDLRQMDLWAEEDQYDKLRGMDRAIDQIRDKHGMDAVKRAVFLAGRVDHMSGGISREKRTVDYSKLEIL